MEKLRLAYNIALGALRLGRQVDWLGKADAIDVEAVVSAERVADGLAVSLKPFGAGDPLLFALAFDRNRHGQAPIDIEPVPAVHDARGRNAEPVPGGQAAPHAIFGALALLAVEVHMQPLQMRNVLFLPLLAHRLAPRIDRVVEVALAVPPVHLAAQALLLVKHCVSMLPSSSGLMACSCIGSVSTSPSTSAVVWSSLPMPSAGAWAAVPAPPPLACGASEAGTSGGADGSSSLDGP